MAGIERELRNYILENYFFNQVGTLGNADSLMELGVIDSTGVLELVSYLEEKYGIEVDAEELVPENLDSIDNLVKFVHRKVAARGHSSPASRKVAATKARAQAGSNA
jgi:acyl carrier protein